jgi:hypothetical protein
MHQSALDGIATVQKKKCALRTKMRESGADPESHDKLCIE